MKENRFSFKQLRLFAFGLSVLALVFFILTCVTAGGACIFFGVMATLALIGSCVCLYLAHRIAVTRTNYFLFDRRRGTVVSPEELTFEFINDNLTHFLCDYIENTIDLWEGTPKNLEMALEAQPAYRTPMAFRMLYDLSLREESDVTAIFHAAKKATVAALCRAIKAGGDKEMADIIFEMKCDPERLCSRIVPFFKKNKRFFEGRIYHYIKQHIHEFDAEKK